MGHTDLGGPKSAATTARECTAILVRDPSGGVLQAGNMDMAPEAVRKITLRITFTRGEEVVFKGVDWYWFNAGVSRAVRAGVASLQENWREGATIPHEQVLQDIENGVMSQIWVFRNLLSSPPANFDAIVHQLETV